MRKLLLAALLLAAAQAAGAQDPKTEDEKNLYAVGVTLGRQLNNLGFKPEELAMVRRGMDDAALGKKLVVDPSARVTEVDAFMRQRMASARDRLRAENADYAKKAAQEKGAQVLPDGIVVTSLKDGSGPNPKPADTVKVNYIGKLIDGTVFDASARHGGAATFGLDGVISCWKQGIPKIKVGGKARLVCPAATAYGEQGQQGIYPGATLVFEVELLGIEGGK